METQNIPVMLSPISAGFPSPAMDYIENTIDICEFLIQHPNSTFILKVKGNSMIEKHIYDGDFLVVDKGIDAKIGSVVIAELGGEFTCKELQKDIKGIKFLKPHNKEYTNIYPNEDDGLIIWGVVVGKFNKI